MDEILTTMRKDSPCAATMRLVPARRSWLLPPPLPRPQHPQQHPFSHVLFNGFYTTLPLWKGTDGTEKQGIF